MTDIVPGSVPLGSIRTRTSRTTLTAEEVWARLERVHRPIVTTVKGLCEAAGVPFLSHGQYVRNTYIPALIEAGTAKRVSPDGRKKRIAWRFTKYHEPRTIGAPPTLSAPYGALDIRSRDPKLTDVQALDKALDVIETAAALEERSEGLVGAYAPIHAPLVVTQDEVTRQQPQLVGKNIRRMMQKRGYLPYPNPDAKDWRWMNHKRNKITTLVFVQVAPGVNPKVVANHVWRTVGTDR